MDLRGKGSSNSSLVDENNALNANNQASVKQRPLIMPMHSRQQPILRFPSVGSQESVSSNVTIEHKFQQIELSQKSVSMLNHYSKLRHQESNQSTPRQLARPISLSKKIVFKAA